MRLEVVWDTAACDVESPLRRSLRIDDVTLEYDGLVACAGDGERSCESRDAASGDDEPHLRKLSSPRGRQQANVVANRRRTRRDSRPKLGGEFGALPPNQ
jgi:hypothetical protein